MSLPDSTHNGPCTYIPARWNGGLRTKDERVVVIHTTESGPKSARAVANYFAGLPSTKKVSSHKIVDLDECITSVKDDYIAWTAPGTNSDGLQLEICARASYSKLDWFKNQAALKRSAWVVANWCIKYSIPASFISVADLKNGKKGLTTHADASKAYGGSDHWDPGPNFPKGYFQFLVRRRIGWLKAS